MTSLSLQQPPFAAPRSLRRLMLRAACASAVAVVGLSARLRRWRRQPPAPRSRPRSLQSGFVGLRVGCAGQRCHVAAARPDRCRNQRARRCRRCVRAGHAAVQSSSSSRRTGFRRPVRSIRPPRTRLPSAGSGGRSSSSGGSTSSGYVGPAPGSARTSRERRAAAARSERRLRRWWRRRRVRAQRRRPPVKQFQRWNGFHQTGGHHASGPPQLSGSVRRGALPPPRRRPLPLRPAATPMSGCEQGANGDKVKELQVALQNTGLVLRGGADGVFGPATTSGAQGLPGVQRHPAVGRAQRTRCGQMLKLGSAGAPQRRLLTPTVPISA